MNLINYRMGKIYFCVILSIFSFSSICSGEEYAQIHLSKGILLFSDGNFNEALDEFQKAVRSDPEDSEAQYYLGIAYSQSGDYIMAIPALKKALKLDPGLVGAHYDLGVAYFARNNYTEALKEMKEAERCQPKRAMVYFYQGYIYYMKENFSRAPFYFQKSASLDAGLSQKCHLYSGMAYLQLGQKEKAESKFKIARSIDFSTDSGLAAEKYLKRLTKEKRAAKRWEFTLSLSSQYDDNVVVQPANTTTAIERADQEDCRTFLYFTGDYRLFRRGNWDANFGYNFYQSIHFELHDYDLQEHNGLLYATHYAKIGNIPVQTGFDYTYTNCLLDEGRYLETHAFTTSFTIMEGKHLLSRVRYCFQDKDFHFSILHPEYDRDGINHGAGFSQIFLFPNQGYLRIGFFWDRDSTIGSDWDYEGGKALLDLCLPLTQRLKLILGGEYYRQNFQNTDSYFSQKRHDDEYTYTVSFDYNPLENLSISLNYLGRTHDSNIADYEYDRNIYSLKFTLNF